jgi:hypothetical protein
MDRFNVEPSGDRFADVVNDVNLKDSLEVVMHYVNDIYNNDPTDIEAIHCLNVLTSIQRCTDERIGNAIS